MCFINKGVMNKLIGISLIVSIISTILDLCCTFYFSPDLSLEANPLGVFGRKYSVSLAWLLILTKDFFLIVVPYILLLITYKIYFKYISNLSVMAQMTIWAWLFLPSLLVVQQHIKGTLSWIIF